MIPTERHEIFPRRQARYEVSNRGALKENIAAIEGGVGCSATATGMAAAASVMLLRSPGDQVITRNDISR